MKQIYLILEHNVLDDKTKRVFGNLEHFRAGVHGHWAEQCSPQEEMYMKIVGFHVDHEVTVHQSPVACLEVTLEAVALRESIPLSISIGPYESAVYISKVRNNGNEQNVLPPSCPCLVALSSAKTSTISSFNIPHKAGHFESVTS